MKWDLETKYVTGIYLGIFPVAGIVESSRVKYGGEVSHLVKLRESIKVFGAVREHVTLDNNEIYYIYDEPPVEMVK